MSPGFPSLPNIEFLIDGNGDVTIGAVGPIACAATAVDEATNLPAGSSHSAPQKNPAQGGADIECFYGIRLFFYA